MLGSFQGVLFVVPASFEENFRRTSKGFLYPAVEGKGNGSGTQQTVRVLSDFLISRSVGV